MLLIVLTDMLTTRHVVLPADIIPSLSSPGFYSRHVGSRNLRLVSWSETSVCAGSAQNIQGECSICCSEIVLTLLT